MKLTKNEIIGLIQYTSGEIDLIDVTENDAESILKDYLKAINYSQCCTELPCNKCDNGIIWEEDRLSGRSCDCKK